VIDPETLSGYPQVGEIIDEKYRIERLLGAGGMGAVLEATHLLRRAPVALKFMSARLVNDPSIVERFLNEGVAASRISNDHVVSVLDVSKLPSGQPYLVMEYLQGEDLAKLLLREGTPGLLDIPRCVHFVLQVLRGLQVAHGASIIHRDLKPANCLVLQRDGEPDFLKIVDFGISKLKSESLNLTKVGSALGTPLYVSPEQARDPASVDARGDLYSVSVILYELLTGRTPFHPKSGLLSELFMQLATMPPEPLDAIRSDLPAGLDRAVQIGLAKSRDDRYRSAAEMAAGLAPFSDSRSERVLRQLLQRSTVNPGGYAPPPPSTGPSPAVLAALTPAPTPMHTPMPAMHTPAPAMHTPPPATRASAPPGRTTIHQPATSFGAPTERAPQLVESSAPVNVFDTVAATTLPTFLRRRQTELKIAVPVLAAIAIGLVLLLSRTGSDDPSEEEAFGAERPTMIDLVPPPPTAPPGVPPAAEPPARPTRPGSVTVVSATTSPGATPPATPPGATPPSAVQPRPLPEQAAPPLAVPIRPVPKATSTPPAARAGSRTEAAPAPPKAPPKKRRPSLKQIGIEE
jgi:serine/threonine protein kinase